MSLRMSCRSDMNSSGAGWARSEAGVRPIRSAISLSGVSACLVGVAFRALLLIAPCSRVVCGRAHAAATSREQLGILLVVIVACACLWVFGRKARSLTLSVSAALGFSPWGARKSFLCVFVSASLGTEPIRARCSRVGPESPGRQQGTGRSSSATSKPSSCVSRPADWLGILLLSRCVTSATCA